MLWKFVRICTSRKLRVERSVATLNFAFVAGAFRLVLVFISVSSQKLCVVLNPIPLPRIDRVFLLVRCILYLLSFAVF